MLTIQLKVEHETANPIKAMKLIDLSFKINTWLRLPPRPRDLSFLLRGRDAPTSINLQISPTSS